MDILKDTDYGYNLPTYNNGNEVKVGIKISTVLIFLSILIVLSTLFWLMFTSSTMNKDIDFFSIFMHNKAKKVDSIDEKLRLKRH